MTLCSIDKRVNDKILKIYQLIFAVSRRLFSKSVANSNDALRTLAFESLSAEEQKLRSSLEQEVKTSFYIAGMALIKLNELRLYRSTHLSFEEFCQDVFGYSSDYAYLKMAAAKVYQNLIEHLRPRSDIPTNGRCLLPTRQRQLRSIVKAKLDLDAQVEVWNMAIALAEGTVPSSSIVSEAVNLYLAEDDTKPNPFKEGQICQIVVRGNSKLKGLGASWCIIEETCDRSCIVNTWNNQLEIPVNNLESQQYDDEQYRAIEDLGVRMTLLHQTGRLDNAALWILEGLAKLDKPYLTPLEEKLLRVLEDFYISHDVE